MKTLALIAALVCAAPVARAHEGAGGTFGLGVGLGSPTVISLEIAPLPRSSLEFAVGLRTFTSDNIYGSLTFKHDLFELTKSPTLWIPIYLGFGGFVRNQDGEMNTDWGVRVPVGINIDLRHSPVQVFGELALELTLRSDLRTDTPVVGLGGLVGVRIWI